MKSEAQKLSWVVSDGIRIYGRAWNPSGESKAVLCLVHGLGEHCGRYDHVAAALTQAGYALFAFDLRGHGNSEGSRGHIPDYPVLMDDITRALDEAGRRYPGKPHFLYGHSLGGNLVLNYVLRCHPQLLGVVATGPALRTAVTTPGWKILFGRTMYRLWPSMVMANGLERKALSRDGEVVTRYRNDPLVHDRLSARLGIDILLSGDWALEHAEGFPLPLLLMHGSADRITSPDASREFAARAGAVCTLIIWDGLYHEIHNEPEQAKVLNTIEMWLDKRIESAKTKA